jgi:hypothetical protein
MKFFNKEDIRDGIIIIKERVSVMGNPHTLPPFKRKKEKKNFVC